MRQFIWRAKCQRTTQNKNSHNRVVRPLRHKILSTSRSFYIRKRGMTLLPNTDGGGAWCNALQRWMRRACADWHGQDPYGNRKKHSSSTTASVVTNHSFWEEEAFRCLYYAEKNSPCFAPRDSATSQLHTRTRLITDRLSDSWPAVHICIGDGQL